MANPYDKFGGEVVLQIEINGNPIELDGHADPNGHISLEHGDGIALNVDNSTVEISAEAFLHTE